MARFECTECTGVRVRLMVRNGLQDKGFQPLLAALGHQLRCTVCGYSVPHKVRTIGFAFSVLVPRVQ